MTVREGAWDCPACGRRANRGPEQRCPGCGFPRGPEVELYLPEDAPELVGANARRKAAAGPDWSCSYCGGDNPADSERCRGCGAARREGADRPVIEHRRATPPPVAPSPARAGSARRPAGTKRRKPRRRYRAKGKRRSRSLAVGCLALLVVASLLFLCGRSEKSTVEATVIELAWQRSIEIERLETVTEKARPEKVPEGARLLAGGRTRTLTERVQVGVERVKVGVRDLGNGYFEDVYEERPIYETVRREVPLDEPIPGTLVAYEIDRWRGVRTVRSSGAGDSPAWPEAELGDDERRGARQALYTARFSGPGGRTLVYRTRDESAWRQLRPGATYRVTVAGEERVVSVAR